jgi:hypothetical protein
MRKPSQISETLAGRPRAATFGPGKERELQDTSEYMKI